GTLALAAAALRPSTDLLQRVGVEDDELKAALATGLVELDGERVLFTHPLLRTAAYELLLPRERRDLHARLAKASVDPVERGHHVARCTVERDEAAAALLDRAGEEAAARGDHAGAAAFLLHAGKVSVEPLGDRASLLAVRAAVELVLAGDVVAA